MTDIRIWNCALDATEARCLASEEGVAGREPDCALADPSDRHDNRNWVKWVDLVVPADTDRSP